MANVVRTLDLGADDYVTKPFHLDLLLARAGSVGRWGPPPSRLTSAASGLVLNPSRREVERDGIAILTHVMSLHEGLAAELHPEPIGALLPFGRLTETIPSMSSDFLEQSRHAGERLLANLDPAHPC